MRPNPSEHGSRTRSDRSFLRAITAPASSSPRYLLLAAELGAPWPSWALEDLEADWRAMAVAQTTSSDPFDLPQYVIERISSGRSLGWQLGRVVLAVGSTPGSRATLARELLLGVVLEQLRPTRGELVVTSPPRVQGHQDAELDAVLERVRRRMGDLGPVTIRVRTPDVPPRLPGPWSGALQRFAENDWPARCLGSGSNHGRE